MDDANNFGYLLIDTSRLYQRRFAQRAAVLGVTLAQSKALGYLYRNPGIAQARLAELCDLEPMNLVRILDRMEADGWIERCADTKDRRAKCLYLKPRAHRLLDELGRIGKQLRAEAIDGVGERDRRSFKRVLDHLYINLAAVESAAPGTGTVPAKPAARRRMQAAPRKVVAKARKTSVRSS